MNIQVTTSHTADDEGNPGTGGTTTRLELAEGENVILDTAVGKIAITGEAAGYDYAILARNPDRPKIGSPCIETTGAVINWDRQALL